MIVALPGLFSYPFLCTVCFGLFVLPLGDIGRLWSVTFALTLYFLNYFKAIYNDYF